MVLRVHCTYLPIPGACLSMLRTSQLSLWVASQINTRMKVRNKVANFPLQTTYSIFFSKQNDANSINAMLVTLFTVKLTFQEPILFMKYCTCILWIPKHQVSFLYMCTPEEGLWAETCIVLLLTSLPPMQLSRIFIAYPIPLCDYEGQCWSFTSFSDS